MGDPDPTDVLDVVGDDHAREILAHASREAMSVEELSDACDTSERTVYRRLERLETLEWIEEHVEIDPDGHHRSVYETALKTVVVELDDGEYDVRIELREDAADRFAHIWRDMRDK